MAAAKFSISIPEYLFASMRDHMIQVGYESVSEYVRELIRRDMREFGREINTITAANVLRLSLARQRER